LETAIGRCGIGGDPSGKRCQGQSHVYDWAYFRLAIPSAVLEHVDFEQRKAKQGVAYFECDKRFFNINSQKRLVTSSDTYTIPGRWIIDEFQFPAMIIPLTDHPLGILHIS
jgi:hypothetical protein